VTVTTGKNAKGADPGFDTVTDCSKRRLSVERPPDRVVTVISGADTVTLAEMSCPSCFERSPLGPKAFHANAKLAGNGFDGAAGVVSGLVDAGDPSLLASDDDAVVVVGAAGGVGAGPQPIRMAAIRRLPATRAAFAVIFVFIDVASFIEVVRSYKNGTSGALVQGNLLVFMLP